DLRVDEAEISFSYRAPGYSADVTVERPQGTYTVTEVRNGFVAVINDLHKGRDAGKVWGWLIDASAILLTLVSFTGLLILLFLYKRRTSGLVLAAVGGSLCVLLYRIFVP
ncbi:MAG: PepSY-associated TM helix domain-containing protein, partial [Rhodospirillales bacterium]|nr:PepSY-associated TM helix domain-containing protein [Acetobacter sp.]